MKMNIKYANLNIIPSLRNPSLNLIWASENNRETIVRI
jgi:hypothetical protein